MPSLLREGVRGGIVEVNMRCSFCGVWCCGEDYLAWDHKCNPLDVLPVGYLFHYVGSELDSHVVEWKKWVSLRESFKAAFRSEVLERMQ